MFCPNCRTQLPQGASHCPNCGTHVAPPTYYSSAAPPPVYPQTPGDLNIDQITSPYKTNPYASPTPGTEPGSAPGTQPPPGSGFHYIGTQPSIGSGFHHATQVPPLIPPVSPPPRKNRTTLFIIVGAAILALVVFGSGLLMVLRSMEGSNTPEPTPTALITITPVSSPTPTALNIDYNSNKNPYTDGEGTLVTRDPMQDNSKNNGWDEQTLDLKDGEKGICGFEGGQYHVKRTIPGGLMCTSRLSYENVTFEATTDMIDGSDVGIGVRIDNKWRGYYFAVNSSGGYDLGIIDYSGDPLYGKSYVPLAEGKHDAIKTAKGETNVLAVSIKGNTIRTFINGYFVVEVEDDKFIKSGEVVLIGISNNKPLDVSFSNVRIWKL